METTNKLEFSLRYECYLPKNKKYPVPLWRTVYREEYFEGYQCLNCKEQWISNREPSSWLCCPNCLVKWAKEWTKKNPRYVYNQFNWETRKFKPKESPEWLIEVYKNRYNGSCPDWRWEVVGRVSEQPPWDWIVFESNGVPIKGVARFLKFYLEHCGEKYPGSPVKITYYDKVNPGKVVKTYV